jgi:hypothetical protein
MTTDTQTGRVLDWSDRLASVWGGVIPLVTILVAIWGLPWLADRGLELVGWGLTIVLITLSAFVGIGAIRRIRETPAER